MLACFCLLADGPAPVPALVALQTAAAERPEQVGLIRDPRLREVSGMAVSRRRPDCWWMINDSGNAAVLYLVGSDGAVRATLDLAPAANRDWEDLASYLAPDGQPWLVIGDCGDNAGQRAQCELLFVAEPEIAQSDRPLSFKVAPNRRLFYTCEGGPRDCEALAVDSVRQEIVLLSKRDVPPAIYVLPVAASEAELQVARRVEGMAWTATPDPVSQPHPFGRQPTAIDISADGRWLGVLTYSRVLLFERQGTESWADVLARPPEALALPPMRQAEALGFDPTGSELWVTTEQLPAPIYRWKRLDTSAPAAP